MKKRIGKLLIEMAADVKKMRQGMQESKKIVKNSSEQMSRFAENAKRAVAGIIGLETVRRFKDWQLTVIDTADEIAKMSKRTGIATEELSALGYAAKLSNVNTAELNTGLRRLARNMDAAKNGTGDAHGAFRELGVAVTNSNGQLRRTEDVINDIAERFSQMADGAQKSAYASRIFGRTGTSLIPMLNEGKEGLKKMRKEADNLGITISTKTAKQAERFNDDMVRLAEVSKGAGLAIAKDLLPHMNLFGNELQKNILKLGGADGLIATLKKTAKVGLLGEDWTATRRERIAELEGLIAAKERAFDRLKKIREEREKELDAMKKQQVRPAELSLDKFGGATGGTSQGVQRMANEVAQYTSKLEAAKKKITEFRNEYSTLTTQVANEKRERFGKAATFSMDTSYMDQLVVDHAAQQKALQEKLERQEAFEKQIEEMKRGALENHAAIGAKAIADDVQRQQEATREIIADYQERANALKGMTDSWTSSLASNIAQATTTGKFRFKDMANSMLQDMVRLASFKVFQPFFGQVFGGLLGGSAFFGTKGHAGANLPAFANGGVVTGPTQALVGEAGAEAILPLVRSGGKLGVQAAGGGGTVVQVIDQRQSGPQVEVERSQGPNGEVIRMIIRDEVDGMIRSGDMDAAANQAWGVTRKGVRR